MDWKDASKVLPELDEQVVIWVAKDTYYVATFNPGNASFETTPPINGSSMDFEISTNQHIKWAVIIPPSENG